jgi:hypothetical protein
MTTPDRDAATPPRNRDTAELAAAQPTGPDQDYRTTRVSEYE